jgi:hypothetical protein
VAPQCPGTRKRNDDNSHDGVRTVAQPIGDPGLQPEPELGQAQVIVDGA